MFSNDNELKDFLDFYYLKYNNVSFIENDPISIPHKFTRKEDIEISAFFASILAWGKRSEIIKKSNVLIDMMDYEPYNFIINASDEEFKKIIKFYYRTFSGDDALYFVHSLKNIYTNKGGLEKVFTDAYSKTGNFKDIFIEFYDIFFELPHLVRTRKHIANPKKGSAAKRLNMFMRWMVRKDDKGVDFGLWNGISQADLMLPLDLHTANTSRKIGLLTLKQNNWNAVVEVTEKLRKLDSNDPIKYDFALFGVSHDKIL
ncbi:MAG: TIGR02757 family protein [Bacteroidales bacterium]|jgi:uncharacterized protein (TIGR02757 family)